MQSSQILRLGLCLFGSISLGLVMACGQEQGTAEKTGQDIDKAIESTSQTVNEAMEATGEAIKEAAENAEIAVENAVESTEKALKDATSEVSE